MPLNDARSVHLPYVLDRLDDGSYVVLNREYKPIGFNTRAHVDYKAYPIAVRFEGLTPDIARKLSVSASEELRRIFFYDSGCVPTDSPEHMDAYLSRLAIFAELQIER